MKATLFALFVGLLMVGCGEKTHYSPPLTEEEVKIIAEAIDVNTLQKRGKKGEELAYAPNEQTPYTGWAKGMRDNGRVESLDQYKDGKREGLETWWYESGQEKQEINYKDGKPISAEAWKPNGKKCPVTNVKNGNGVVVWYNEDGTEQSPKTYGEGELVED